MGSLNAEAYKLERTIAENLGELVEGYIMNERSEKYYALRSGLIEIHEAMI